VVRHELSDPLIALKQKAHVALLGRLGARLNDPNLSAAELRRIVRTDLDELLQEEVSGLSPEERTALVSEISEDLLGLGPIESFMSDPQVTEVMVNGDDAIFVERGGRLYLSDARFVSQDHLLQVIQRIVTSVGRRIDHGSPMVDARLPDGSRVNAVIPPLSIDGPMLTIRKFSKSMLELDDLVTAGALTADAAELMKACVIRKKSILISGGTGSGKTTMLNALSAFIPDGERIITIEDAAELQLAQRHTVRLESRPANVEGVGEISIRDLVRNSLRMRPDRIIVGEVRGAEALDMLQAMNTGHSGSLSTVHANTPRDALSRIETMVLSAGVELPLRAIREQVASAIDLVIQIGRMIDGRRGVLGIAEVGGMEGDTIKIRDLFELVSPSSGELKLEATGVRASFFDDLGLGATIATTGYGDERKTFW
jgi:pilus assembly protein CpaF